MNPANGPSQHIILIGFMGCGKSTIGRILHRMLGDPLVDLDQLIEEKAGMAITDIFARRGEPFFRMLEAAVLQELAAPGPRKIVSTGGGIVTRRRNRALLRQLGFVVWLQAPVDAILERTRRNRDRPLLNTENPREKVEALLNQRIPLYENTAHLAIDTSNLDAEETACGIIESARYYWTQEPEPNSTNTGK